MTTRFSVHLPDRISKNIQTRATQTGSSMERVIVEALKRTFSTPPVSPKQSSEQEYALGALIAAGMVRPTKPTPRRVSQRISGKRRSELAKAFSSGKPLSRIVIEDRRERV
ncbi:MAG: hypothetical protein HY327_10490 [Chloroflexi bacterium]|nr:hypothetical protein [Chloroflexota bacterium]